MTLAGDIKLAEAANTLGPQLITFRIEINQRQGQEISGRRFVQSAQQMGHSGLSKCRVSRLFFLQGNLTSREAQRVGHELLADSVTETFTVCEQQDPAQNGGKLPAFAHTIDVTLLPGVTDPAAENLVRAAHLLGIDGLERAATGQRYLLTGELSTRALQQLAAGLFANPVIQRFAIDEPITAPLFIYQQADETVETIALREAGDDELLAISAGRRLALNLAEMQAIRDYFHEEGREPTDVELEMLAQTWSEHCVHKTFRATIHYNGPLPGTAADSEPVPQTINSLLKTYIRGATEKANKSWVRSAFVDNAGIVAFDDEFDLAFKVETHNHPSALEPFGGANTGVGGVVRDVLGVSARPIANTDVLCFGPPDLPETAVPEGVLHPRRIADGVVHGVEDYGNKMGIPTVNGAILYHPGYTANPLVYCGCLGLLPHGSHPTGAQPGDLIMAIGGRTGRDGLRGATFSSMEMDQETSEIAGSAVQIGDPIQEKRVQEVVLRARDERLYTAITDCGAGGFSSAVGEMAQHVGACVQLTAAPLKYPGLRPWEIWLSEAQERMILAVPPANRSRLEEICAGQDVEVVSLGEFQDSGRLRLFYGDRLAGDVAMAFLHDGIPLREMEAVWRAGEQGSRGAEERSFTPAPAHPRTSASSLLALLAHPNIRSKEDVVRRYDHEVQGGTAVKPLTGVANHGPSDAAVLVPLDSQLSVAKKRAAVSKAVALANGVCPQYGEIDPYLMAWAAVDEALRNVVAVGADPDQVSLLDNFCWGNPNLPDRLGALVRCAQGCYDAAVAFQAPFISGKDSLNNEYTGADGQKHAIPGTLLISALSIVPDVNRAVTMDLKQAGNFLFMAGATRGEMGGSHLVQVAGQNDIPNIDMGLPQPVPDALAHYRALHQVMQAGLIRACHDCSEGGLAVTLAEMCLAGRLGAQIELIQAPRGYHADYLSDPVLLFSESLSRFVVEVRPEDAVAFRAILGQAGVPHECFGVVGGERLIVNGRQGQPVIDVSVVDLEQAWRGDAGTEGGGEVGTRGGGVTNVAVSPPHCVAASSSHRVLVLHANGTNRDRDAALACEVAGGQPEIVHVNQLLAGERRLLDYHMLVIPGGFSYGDDLGAGKLWALDLRHRLGQDVARFVESGRPVLGICNGFQALVKAALLPGQPVEAGAQPLSGVTLTFNRSAHFECRWVYLQPNSHSHCLFTRGLDEPIFCPVAHGEGRLAVAHEEVAAELQANGLIALTYVDGQGETAVYPANPNGSILNIAGLCNAAGNVMGLMPHPEDHIFPWQHPRRLRGEVGLSGLRLFQNGIRAI